MITAQHLIQTGVVTQQLLRRHKECILEVIQRTIASYLSRGHSSASPTYDK